MAENVQDENQEFSDVKKSSVLEKVKTFLFSKELATWLPAILLALALPITVFVAMQRQNLRNFAANQDSSLLTSVAINPGEINILLTNKSVPLSALAYDVAQNPMYKNISYEWSMSSVNSIGTLTRTDGDITEFLPLKSGYAAISAIAREGDKSVEKTIQVTVRNPDGTLPPTPTPSQQKLSLNPQADSYVRSDRPEARLGGSARLYVDGSPKYISFMKFNLKPLAGKTVTKAILRVKVHNSSSSVSPATQNIKKTSNSWSEGKITYNNMPELGATFANLVANKKATYFDVDVTIWASANAGQIASFAIQNPSNNDLILNSKEATTGKPTLIVTFQ